jgi:hypothetical protein
MSSIVGRKLVLRLSISTVVAVVLLAISVVLLSGGDRHERSVTIPVRASMTTQTLSGTLDFSHYLPAVSRAGENQWADCSRSSFGTMLMTGEPGDYITPASILINANDQLGVKGVAGAGAPSESVRDEWFSRLPGWTRLFLRGTYSDLLNVHDAAAIFDMEDMYECIGYGPESAHQAGQEALDPVFWVPQAEARAQEAGKCLVYGPAVQDYERMSTPEGDDEPREDLLAGLITQVAPHVDVWVVQLAKYQAFVDHGRDLEGDPYTMDDFEAWIDWWVATIKTANRNAEVWTQLGVGRFDPLERKCQPPQTPEYVLEYRTTLLKAGVDNVWVMPGQPCQLSEDPQDHEYYLQSLVTFQDAMRLACGQGGTIDLP